MQTQFFILALAGLYASESLLAIPIRILAWDHEVAGRHLAIVQIKGQEIIQAMHPSRRTGDLPSEWRGSTTGHPGA